MAREHSKIQETLSSYNRVLHNHLVADHRYGGILRQQMHIEDSVHSTKALGKLYGDWYGSQQSLIYNHTPQKSIISDSFRACCQEPNRWEATMGYFKVRPDRSIDRSIDQSIPDFSQQIPFHCFSQLCESCFCGLGRPGSGR